MSRSGLVSIVGVLLITSTAGAQARAEYEAADRSQRPGRGGTEILPEQFLRGFDPVTVYFPDNVAAAAGPADDGEKLLKLAPRWPGAWVWADRKTLQFRPAEAWPALSRFAFEARGVHRVLTTLMSAPSAMSPAAESDGLRPLRSFTLTFAQPMPEAALRTMLSLEIRDAPGLNDSPRKAVRDFTLTQLPRARRQDPALYAVTLPEEMPEGKQLLIRLSLGLGDVGKVLWTAHLSTRAPFHLEQVDCGAARLPLSTHGALPRELALACGNNGETPQLVFSAPLKELSLGDLRKLVRLEPSVPDLHFALEGGRLTLQGRFLPDVLYRMRLNAAPIVDDTGRPLVSPAPAELFFHLGWKTPFLRFNNATAMLESNGPRTVSLTGYGEPRADVRIYRVDPFYPGIWPFPSSPVVVQEETAPPFPGEEPAAPELSSSVASDTLIQHIRLLGSPLVSRVVDLPLADKNGTTHFGLDLAPLLDPVVGRNKPGTYLVGLRRLSGAPERVYMRVQITNLSLSAAEERERTVFFVRALDHADAVRGAQIILEGQKKRPPQPNVPNPPDVPFREVLTTDGEGKAVLGPHLDWTVLRRVSVQSGEDTLVLDTQESPPRFAENHWSPGGMWLSWLNQTPPPASGEGPLGFVFTERGIYRPGDAVLIKGYARQRVHGEMQAPGSPTGWTLEVALPNGQTLGLPIAFTALGGFSAIFRESDVPSGDYTVALYKKGPTAQEKQQVAFRAFKIEAYRIPNFEVQLTGAPQVSLDVPFKVKAVGRYYAGGNLSGQPISWRITRRAYYSVPKDRPGFIFASSAQFARPGMQRGSEAMSREGELDKSGAAEVSINPALDLDGSPRIYRFEATVTGPDDQQVSAAHEVRALPPFSLGIKMTRFLQHPGTLTPQIIAVGPDDRLMGQQEITLRLYRRVWHSQLRESPFAMAEPKYLTEQEDVKVLERTLRSEDKPLSPSLPLKEAGVYVVELSSRDRLGRVQTLSTDLYVGGDQPLSWNKSREGVFEVKFDRAEYKPGETAHLVIQSPFQTGQALVVEEDPSGNRYTWKSVSGGKAVHDIVVQARYVPNLPVHVLLMRGRLGEGKSDDSRYKPATLGASADLVVLPTQNLVQVAIEHPEVARPGSKIDVTLTLKDAADRPLSGEVTLWLVDEAVLSLAKEQPFDPLSTLLQRHAPGLTLRDTRNLIQGRVAEQEESPGGDGGDIEDQNAGGKPVVRRNFKTVPFYEATLLVPPSGKLVVPVQLSDDLTNFRIRAVAASGLQRFGTKQSTLRVRLPVLVQPQLPRFVRQGDRFWGGALGRVVEGDEGPARLTLEVKGPAKAQVQDAVANLTRAKPQSFLTSIQVDSAGSAQSGELRLRACVVRQKDNQGDAFEVKLPVLPDSPPETFAYFTQLQVGKTLFKAPPEKVRPGSVDQEVVLSSTRGVLALASGLDYLSEYPYGCLEQRMSQLAPDIELAGLLKTLDLPTRFTPQLTRYLQQLNADLTSFQDDRGLLAFWPGGTGDVQLTAQSVELMAAASSAGLPIDARVQNRAIEGLKKSLRSDAPGAQTSCRFDDQTAALLALGRAHQLDEHYWGELFHQRTRMDLSSRADLSLPGVAKPASFQGNLNDLKGELWDNVIIHLQGGKPTYDGVRYTVRDWNGCLGSPVAQASALLEALVDLDPQDSRLTLLRNGLLSMSTPENGFGSTYDNRRALQALAAYLLKSRESGQHTQIQIAGLSTVDLDDAHKARRLSTHRDAPLEASLSGSPVEASVRYRYLPGTPADHATARAQGLIVSRTVTQVHQDGAPETHADDKSGDQRKLPLGDIWELHTRVVSNDAHSHVALVVPFAAGLELMNPALETSGANARASQADSLQPAYVQRLDHEVRYFFLNLPKGTFSFHFRVRASTEGSFVHPAPYAEAMYHPEIRGRGDGMRVIVTGAHEH